MQDTGLIVEDQGAVRTLRLHRPAVHNAFDATLIAALTDALRQAGQAPQIRVVVLTGDGAAFSAGADLNGCAAWRPPTKPRTPPTHWRWRS